MIKQHDPQRNIFLELVEFNERNSEKSNVNTFMISGDVINQWYDVIMIPAGVIGNVLSFMVYFVSFFFYRLSTKLQECNAFSRVCLSVCLFTGRHTIHACPPLYKTLPSLDMLKLVQLGPQCTRTLLSR